MQLTILSIAVNRSEPAIIDNINPFQAAIAISDPLFNDNISFSFSNFREKSKNE